MPAASIGAHNVTLATGSTITSTAVTTQATGSTFIVASSSSAFNTLTDNYGNTYTKIQFQDMGANGQLNYWHCVNGVGGAGHQVTAGYGTSAARALFFLEVVGGRNYHASTSVQDTTSPYTVSQSTSYTDSVFVLFPLGNTSNSVAVLTESTGFTKQDEVTDNTTYFAAATFTKTGVAASTTETPSITTSGGIAFALALAVYYNTPTISSQPANQTVETGSSATFSVTASAGGGTLSYQWERNTGSGWSPISGATSSSYNTGTVTTAQDGYQYRVVVTDANGSTTSNAATLDVWVDVFDGAVFDSAVFDTGVGGITATMAFTLDDVVVASSATLGHTATSAITLDSVVVASSATLGHTATLAATLDGITVASSATLGHPATLAATLDGITFAANASIGGSLTATIAFTLDGVTVACNATLGHTATLAAILDDVSVAATATTGHTATAAFTLDSISTDISATVSSPGAITATIAFTLDSIAVAIDAIVQQQTIFVDTHDGEYHKKKFRKEVSDKQRRKQQIIDLYEELVELKPKAAAEAIAPFVHDAVKSQSESIDFSVLLQSLDRTEALYNALQRELQEIDDEDILLLL